MFRVAVTNLRLSRSVLRKPRKNCEDMLFWRVYSYFFNQRKICYGAFIHMSSPLLTVSPTFLFFHQLILNVKTFTAIQAVDTELMPKSRKVVSFRICYFCICMLIYSNLGIMDHQLHERKSCYWVSLFLFFISSSHPHPQGRLPLCFSRQASPWLAPPVLQKTVCPKTNHLQSTLTNSH